MVTYGMTAKKFYKTTWPSGQFNIVETTYKSEQRGVDGLITGGVLEEIAFMRGETQKRKGKCILEGHVRSKYAEGHQTIYIGNSFKLAGTECL